MECVKEKQKILFTWPKKARRAVLFMTDPLPSSPFDTVSLKSRGDGLNQGEGRRVYFYGRFDHSSSMGLISSQRQFFWCFIIFGII